ncbi:MAG: thymidine kinase [Alphaproteobacteria bacterium]|nr:thymidine kinase [Alphaproteobacteria bacterium]
MAKLHFYYSAMNAGKTTTLLQSSYNYHERGMNTMLFKPSLDNRSDVDKISSRIGLMANAIQFDDKFDFYTYVSYKLHQEQFKIQCILIDEAQFLSKDQVQQLVRIVNEYNIAVLTYGLRTDFRGEPFEGSQYLLAWAEELVEIKTICYCGRKATMNMRIDKDGKSVREGNQVEIGGNERYIATCRKHFLCDIPHFRLKNPGQAIT